MLRRRFYIALLLFSILFTCGVCKKNGSNNNNAVINPATNDLDFWLTTADQAVLLQKQGGVYSFGTGTAGNPVIQVDSSVQYQSVEGFGYTLTGGSAYLINHMNAADRSALLNEIFGDRKSVV